MGHWFFTWDLKSGYHHVDICPDHQKYLGFAWPFSGVVRYFTFAVLPFGLSSACFCFNKLIRPLARSMGHNSFVYLDDVFGSQVDKFSATAASIIRHKELSSSGLLCNEEKSRWTPMQIGEWLGFVIGSISTDFISDSGPLVGGSRPEANLQSTSLGLQWLPEIQNVSLTI